MKKLSLGLILFVMVGCTKGEKVEHKGDAAETEKRVTDQSPEQKAMDSEFRRKGLFRVLMARLADESAEKRQAAYVELRDVVVRKRDIPELRVEIARNANPGVTIFWQRLIEEIDRKSRLPDKGWTFDSDVDTQYEEKFEKYGAWSIVCPWSIPGTGSVDGLDVVDYPQDTENRLEVINLILTLEPQILRLLGEGWTDIRFLGLLTDLDTLEIESASVGDISALKGLKKLRVLSLKNTQVLDLSPLKGLTELERLRLENTKVADLTPLKGMPRISRLFLSNTMVTDLTPLLELPSLQNLHLGNTRVTDLTPLTRMHVLNRLTADNPEKFGTSPVVEKLRIGIRNSQMYGDDF